VELGLSAFDLAASYQAGGTERLFGLWMKQRGKRSDLFLSTKGGHPLPVIAPHRLSRAALESDLHASLKRLRTDHVDLYFLHRDDRVTPLEEIVETLLNFQRDGKVLALGVSNWHHTRIDALRQAFLAAGSAPPIWSSPQFSCVAWTRPPWPGCVSISDDGPAQTYMKEQGLTVLAWSPLAGGYLASQKGNPVYDTPQNRARRERLGHWAKEQGISIELAALAWLKSAPFTVIPTVAARRIEHMEANLRGAGLRMSEQQRSQIAHG
jgi:aryl-alcohol dehydrogenase-like predicted oxidoreductase